MKLRYKILILLILLIGGAVLVGSQFEPVKAATRKIVYNIRFKDGLVGYWSFNGPDVSGVTAIDRGSSGTNGTLTSGPTIAPGAVGQALNFDGSNDYVDGGTITTFNLASISVSAWVYVENVDTYYGDGLTHSGESVVNAYDPTNYGWKLGVDKNGKPVWMYYNNTGGCIADVITSSGSSVVGGWHNLVGVRSTAGLELFVDGISVGTDTQTCADLVSSRPFFIGQWRTSLTGDEFDGSIDEVRVYDRVLTVAEIIYQYNRTKPAGSGTVAKSVANNSGLTGYWDFDDCDTCTTVIDRSGNSNTGTMYNAAGPTEGDLHTASGKVGRGASFDGSNDYVAFSDPVSAEYVTVSAWVKNNSPAGASPAYEYVVSNDRDCCGSYKGYSLSVAYTSNVPQFVIWDSLSAKHTVNGPSEIRSDGRWHHLAGTYDGTNLYIYVDGIAGSPTAYTGTIGTPASFNLAIGGLGTGPASYNMQGFLDEVRIYNRALSAAEVKNLYDSTRKMFVNIPPKDLLTDGLVGFWSFNGPDMSGVTAYDRSGSGYDGTLTAGPKATPGVVGQALEFDGVDDYVNAGSTSGIDSLTSNLSVAAWIKPDSVSALQRIASHARATTANGFGFGVINAGLRFTTYAVKDYDSTVITLVAGRWYHVVAVLDSDFDVTFYVDGASQQTVTHTAAGNADTDDNFYMGAQTASGAPTLQEIFDGSIDEVRVYNRSLSAAEVLRLYNSTKH